MLFRGMNMEQASLRSAAQVDGPTPALAAAWTSFINPLTGVRCLLVSISPLHCPQEETLGKRVCPGGISPVASAVGGRGHCCLDILRDAR